MPLESTSPTSPAASRSWFRSVLRATWVALQIAVVIFCLLLLAVRFVVFPRIESNRDELTRMLSQYVGSPVAIVSLRTGWDGWNPRIDIDGFRVLNPDNGVATVTLPHVRLVAAWTSLVVLELRLKELTIDGPELAVRRDADGMLHVAGLRIDPAAKHDDRRVADWLLKQPRIVVHGASLTWRDEHGGGAELVLEGVELRLEQRFGHHRFGLRGAPPEALAAPLDLRGDLTGVSTSGWQRVAGHVYARLDYADIAAWREWLPLSVPIRSGKGALRVWLDIGNGIAPDVVADVVLSDVEARLAPDLPELSLSGLEGRLGWRDDGSERQFYTQRLTFAARNGTRFEPTDFKLVMHDPPGGVPTGSIEFTRIELGPLREIAAFVPLPAKWREELARLAPTGTFEGGTLQWSGEPSTLQAFTGSSRFTGVGFAAQGGLPGLAGASGSFDAGPQGGTLKLDSRNLTLDAPRMMASPLVFDTFSTQLRWHRDKQLTTVDIDQMAFANADLTGSARGSYVTTGEGPGRSDINAQITRADARAVHRYLPLALDQAVRDWMRGAILGGNVSDGRVRVVGPMADFPFVDGKGGQFQVQFKAQDIRLEYAQQWPPLDEVAADLRIDGARVQASVLQGRIYGVNLGSSRVDIPDVRAAAPLLHVDGTAAGPTNDFLRYIAASPLDRMLEHPGEGVEIGGTGKLTLKMQLPLGRPQGNKIDGEYAFDNGRVQLAGGTPPLDHLSGKLEFSEREVHAAALTGELVGGPARFVVATTDGKVHVDGQGSINLALLRNEYPKHPLLARVSGTTDWRATVTSQLGNVSWVVDSTLKGAVVDFPAPVGKSGADTVALKIERDFPEPEHDLLTVTYGRVGRLVIERRLTPSGATPERALLALGTASGVPDKRGFWIRGDVPAINADAWLALKEQLDAGPAGDDLQLAGADVSIGALEVYRRQFTDLHVGATRAAGEWQIELRGPEVTGSARWQSAAAGRPNGRLVARLQKVVAPNASPNPPSPAVSRSDAPPVANPWPALDISADTFTMKNHDLGKLELIAQPSASDWRIDSLKITNDDSTLTANGWWRNTVRAQQTELDVDLDVRDAGKYLGRMGLPDAIRAAPTRLRGKLAWAGSPQDFDYLALNGAFNVETGPGQFLKVDPGIGKLLGVLSLQAFRRRLSGDYQDVFGEGFAFDEITGDVGIQDGIMKSDNLRIAGPAARVSIMGEADLSRETQNLRIRVQPTLSASLSMGAAALMLANPIVGAVIGAGSLLAQKIMQDPVEQIFSTTYVVTGGWSDPHVERAGAAPAAATAEGLKR
jgi:uncharacterized protein (TIGR02099 family)